MQFDEAIQLMKELKTPYIKVSDTSGNRIFDVTDEQSVENTIDKLKTYLKTIRSLGAVIFVCATETCKKQNWKDAFKWRVTFEGVIQTETKPENNNHAHRGYISQSEANLMAQVQVLQMQMQFNAKLEELNKKIEGNDKPDRIERIIDKYAPIAGAFFNITPEKYENMAKIASIQGMMGGSNSKGIAGVNPTANNVTQQSVELSPEEKKQVEDFNNEIEKLSEKTDLEKLTALVRGLNANPGYIDMALGFMNNNLKK